MLWWNSTWYFSYRNNPQLESTIIYQIFHHPICLPNPKVFLTFLESVAPAIYKLNGLAMMLLVYLCLHWKTWDCYIISDISGHLTILKKQLVPVRNPIGIICICPFILVDILSRWTCESPNYARRSFFPAIPLCQIFQPCQFNGYFACVCEKISYELKQAHKGY